MQIPAQIRRPQLNESLFKGDSMLEFRRRLLPRGVYSGLREANQHYSPDAISSSVVAPSRAPSIGESALIGEGTRHGSTSRDSTSVDTPNEPIDYAKRTTVTPISGNMSDNSFVRVG